MKCYTKNSQGTTSISYFPLGCLSKRLILPFLFVLSIINLTLTSTTFASEQIKSTPLQKQLFFQKLQVLQKKNVQKITKLRQAIDQILSPSSVTIASANHVFSQAKKLSSQLHEYKLRQIVLDRTSFYVEQNYNISSSNTNSSSLNKFLAQHLIALARDEIINTTSNSSDRNAIAKYFLHQGLALKELLNERLDTCDFIESYLNYSSVSKPKSPVEYLASQQYSQPGKIYTGTDKQTISLNVTPSK